jgi:uncharacterized membrane protein
MSFLRFLMLLSLVVWLGGLTFFAFVIAPTAFQVLPNTHVAGNIVGRSLTKLHWIAIGSGIVFLLSSLLYSRVSDGAAHVFAMRHVLICLMLGLTLFSQFWIIPRMDTLRAQVGDFAARSRSTILPACSSTPCTSGPRVWKVRCCCWGWW